jgi:steroid delta-isomerase
VTARPRPTGGVADDLRRSTVPLLLLLAITLPAASARAQQRDAAADEAAIRRSLATWVEAANAGDDDRASAIWAPDLIGWYPGQPDDSYEREIRAAADRRRSGSAPTFEIGLEIVEVMVSGDQAVVRDVWTFTPRAKDGPPAQVVRGFEVWKRQTDGVWRIARWLSAPEPASPPAAASAAGSPADGSSPSGASSSSIGPSPAADPAASSTGPAASAVPDSAGLSERDRSAIRAVQEAYRQGWLANDSAAVMRTFTEDAVLVPHHGVAQVEGAAAVRAFWWPPGPPTTITAFTLTDMKVAGRADLAYVRGRSAVAWTQGEPDRPESFRNEGNFLSILRREPDGGWRIALQMWTDPPNQRVAPQPADGPQE